MISIHPHKCTHTKQGASGKNASLITAIACLKGRITSSILNTMNTSMSPHLPPMTSENASEKQSHLTSVGLRTSLKHHVDTEAVQKPTYNLAKV